MNKQDKEDFEQDFAICVLVGKYAPTHIKPYRDFYARSMSLALQRRTRLEKQYVQHLEIMADMPGEKLLKEELIFQMLESLNNLPTKQRKVILSFLKTGNLAKVAADLRQNYNTTKANFRLAVITLREMLHGRTNLDY